MKKTTVILSKKNEELYRVQVSVINSICSDYKNCPISLCRIDEYEIGNFALKELVKRTTTESETIIIDLSCVVENDIRLRFIKELNNIDNLKSTVVACMSSVFTKESAKYRRLMRDALHPTLKPASIVFYADAHDSGLKLSSILKGEFNFMEIEEVSA